MARHVKNKRAFRPSGLPGTKYTYTVVFEPDLEDGGWVATAPILGVTTQGESLEEARRNIREATAGYLQGLRDAGLVIPCEPDRQPQRIRTEQIAVKA